MAEFRRFAATESIAVAERVLRFPGRVVLHARATRDRIGRSIDLLNRIAELRRARIAVEEFLGQPALDQSEWVEDLAGRLQPAPHDAAVVCILDTGVNRAHPLLAATLPDNGWLAYDQDWGSHDHHGHGTEVAGIAAFGDLAEALASDGPFSMHHSLESVKVLPPPNKPANRPELFGAITREAIARAEIASPPRARIVCITATTAVPDTLKAAGSVTEQERDELLAGVNECRRRGRPSSWSAAIDAIASGAEDAQRRLVILSAGNTDRYFRRYYPDSNLTEGIHDPGQAWNALTIGACTELDAFDEKRYPGWLPIAPKGDLSPSSSTSMVWQEQWPTKPDLCLEGGNQAIDPASGEADYVDDLQLLTTHRSFENRPLTVTGDTSAAAGLASRMAAMVSSQYSELWPETTRGLLVH